MYWSGKRKRRVRPGKMCRPNRRGSIFQGIAGKRGAPERVQQKSHSRLATWLISPNSTMSACTGIFDQRVLPEQHRAPRCVAAAESFRVSRDQNRALLRWRAQPLSPYRSSSIPRGLADQQRRLLSAHRHLKRSKRSSSLEKYRQSALLPGSARTRDAIASRVREREFDPSTTLS